MNKDVALKKINELKDDIEQWVGETKIIIVSVDFDSIRTGKYLSTKETDLDGAIKELNRIQSLIEDWNADESYHYSAVFFAFGEIFFELNTSDIDELEEEF